MHDIYFDRIIKEKLQALKVALDPADWNLLLEQFNQSFYESLRTRLNLMEAPLDSTDWQALAQQLDEAFDQEIREIFEHLAVEPLATDWPLMATSLEAMPLDQAIFQQLASLEVAPDPADWQLLSRELDEHPLDSQLREPMLEQTVPVPEDAWEMFEAHEAATFDQALADKIADYQLPLPSADWQNMEQMLDGNQFDSYFRNAIEAHHMPIFTPDWQEMAEILEAPFDQRIKEKLDGLELAMPTRDWKAFAALLPAPVIPITTWRRAAAAAIILLLMTWGGTSWYRTAQLPNQMAAVEEVPVESEGTSEEANSNLIANREASAAMPLQANASPPEVVHTEASEITSEIRQVANISGLPPVAVSQLVQELPASIVIAAQIPPTQSAEQAVREQNKQPTSPFRLDRLGALDNSLGFALEQERGLDLLDPMNDRPKPEITLSLYGGTTRTKAELNDAIEAQGYTTGLRLGLNIRNGWKVVAGFLYGTKQFTHEYPVIQDNFLGTGKVNGQLTVLEAPILLRYEFPDIHGLHLYGQAGVVTLVSIEENYEDRNPTSPVNAATLSRRVDPDLLEAETLTWNLNTYPGNVHLALGMRYAFTDQLSIEVEPYFQQSLQKTKGSSALSYQKKLYTSGIGFGLNYTLGTK